MEVERLRGDRACARAELDEYKDSTEKNVQELTEKIGALRSQHESEVESLQRALSDNQKLSAANTELEQKLKMLEAAEPNTSEELRRENQQPQNRQHGPSGKPQAV